MANTSLDNFTYYLDYNDSSGDETKGSVADIVGIWVTGSFCLLGLAGNILSFIVLWRAFTNSPMFLVLRAVAVSDAVFLFTVLVIQTLVNMRPYIKVTTWCDVYRGHIQYYMWPVMMITQMSTVWLTVLVSGERYIAICHPLRAASWCTINKVRKCTAAIFVSSILFNIPRFFEFYVSPGGGSMSKTDIANNNIYSYLYNCVLYALTLFLIPLGFLLFLNIKLVLALREGKKQWQSLQFRQKKEQNLTIIPLTIVLIFFLCGTPSLVVNIIDSLDPDVWQNSSFVTFMVVANFLVVLNSASNFIIYCLLGQKFRDKLLELCQCQYSSSKYRVVHHLVSTRSTQL